MERDDHDGDFDTMMTHMAMVIMMTLRATRIKAQPAMVMAVLVIRIRIRTRMTTAAAAIMNSWEGTGPADLTQPFSPFLHIRTFTPKNSTSQELIN